MRKISLLWGLACLLAAADCFADTRNVEALIDEKLLLPAYKLGGSYKSKNDNSVSCLEGHSGAILNNKTCLAGNNASAKGCTDSECKNLGEGYYCSKVTKKCEQEECSSDEDSDDCALAYAKAMPGLPDVVIESELRTCVSNESKDGGHYCKVTCSLEHIIAQSGLSQAEVDRMLKLLAADLAAYKKPSKAAEYYGSLTFDKNNPDANGIWDEDKFDLLMSSCLSGEGPDTAGFRPLSPACVAAQGSTYGYRDETGDIPTEGLSLSKVDVTLSKVENVGSLYEYVAGDCDTCTFFVLGCGLFWQYSDYLNLNNKLFASLGAKRTLNGHAIADRIRKHFKTTLNNKEYYAFNSALYERIKEPDIYYLGQSPVCARYYDSSRNYFHAFTSWGYSTTYMFYIPQQDVIAWRRHKREGETTFTSDQWDLSTGDRVACCADAHVQGKVLGDTAVYCIDLTNDYDVVDIDSL